MRRRAFFVLPSEAMGQTSSAKSAERSSRLAAGRPPDAEPPDAGRVVEGAWDRSPRGDQGLRAGVDPDLPGQDRQDAVPGSAPGARRDAATSLARAKCFALSAGLVCLIASLGRFRKSLFTRSAFATGAARRGGFR